MFNVLSKVFNTYNKGTAHEFTSASEPRYNGPFESRISAEAFARGLATQPNIAEVTIKELAEEEEN